MESECAVDSVQMEFMKQRSRRDSPATTSEDTVCMRVDAEAIAGAGAAPERPPG